MYSVYTRIVRLVLAEKNIAYDLAAIDVFDAEGPPAAYLNMHPFGRIPALEHGSLQLYETGAITRYLDAAFPTPPLQPRALRSRARVDQIISILDSYAYRTMVWDIFVERIRAPVRGRQPDEACIAAALPRARTCLEALDALRGRSRYLVGSRLTIADLHAAPMFAYFTMTPEGKSLIGGFPALATWWVEISARPSVVATRSPYE
jgi:glutathione S-transferase